MPLAQLTILAPGLLGGSVAKAARERGCAERIVIWARRAETRLALKEQTWCDAVESSPAAAAQGATLVVIASPVDHIVPLAQEISGSLVQGAVVTDVGSVKGEISRLGEAALTGGAHFVGSHPMAGSEKTGWENSRADLFANKTCFVTPLSAPSVAVERVVKFWRDLGAQPVTMDPDAHDEIVAHISHLPQILASSLCAFLAQKNPAWRNFAGNGLRDTTRIAGSDPEIWRSILAENRDEVLRALREFEEDLHGWQTALANRDFVELSARLERAQAYRQQFRP